MCFAANQARAGAIVNFIAARQEPPAARLVSSPIRGNRPPRRGLASNGSGLRASPFPPGGPSGHGMGRYGNGELGRVNQKSQDSLSEIEETQAALRGSIETARQLAERSDFLLQKHKQHTEQNAAAAERDAYLRENPD